LLPLPMGRCLRPVEIPEFQFYDAIHNVIGVTLPCSIMGQGSEDTAWASGHLSLVTRHCLLSSFIFRILFSRYSNPISFAEL